MILADFLEFYGLNLVEVLKDQSMSPRLLLSLMDDLPMGARFKWEAGGYDKGERLSRLELMTADLFDATMVSAHAAASSKKSPVPYPRPQIKDVKKMTESEKFDRLFNSLGRK